MTEKFTHRIRSFVRRQGRLTPGQQRAIDELFPVYGLEADGQPLDLTQVYDRQAPTILEIGFGNGASLAQIAAAHPHNNYLGIEVHLPGVGHLLQLLEEQGLHNVRVMCADAVEVLELQIADGALEALYLFFPDPWHKKKHHKRRQVRPEWVELVHRKLRSGGILHMATDWEDYAIHMLEVVSGNPGFANTSPGGDYVPRPDYRPETKFERRGQRLGHGVWDLVFQKKA